MRYLATSAERELRVDVESIGPELGERLLRLAAVGLGRLLPGYGLVDSLEEADLDFVCLDRASGLASEMLIEHIVALAPVSGDCLAGFRRNVLRVDGEEPFVDVAEGKAEHFAFLTVGVNCGVQHRS